MIAGSLNSPSCAEDGLVFPDSARVSFNRAVVDDTVIVVVQNLSADSVISFYFSEFTDSLIENIECLVDGQPAPDSIVRHSYNDVYPDRHTTRWLVGAFSQALRLKYYSNLYSSCELSWSAGHPYAIFGTMPLIRGIEPPRNVSWGQ